MSKKKILLVVLGCISLILIAVITVQITTGKINLSSSLFAKTEEISGEEEVNVIYTSTDFTMTDEESETYTDYNAKINLSDLSSSGNGVSMSNKTIIIGNAGVYYFTGTTTDGNILVEASKDDEVVLVFDNASIESTNTSAINITKAKLVTISLVKGTTNSFSDASTYTNLNEDEEPDGTIFSKSDLKITGEGTIKVTANYKDGIVSKDTLTVIDSTVIVKSADDGIRGKDSITLKNANVTVESKGDGIKSTNDSDEKLGYILIKGGKINISSEADGIQAEQIINITDSEITIKTTGKIDNNHQETFGRIDANNTQNATTKTDYENRTQSATSQADGENKIQNVTSKNNSENTASQTDSASSKGLKAGKEITINSGIISITSTDDAIHSNYYVIINDGEMTLSSEDDGLHADTNIIINGGAINIKKSYEGIEANYIEINNGKVSVIASDDGINVSGGNDQSAMGYGRSNFSNVNTGNRKLVINGGSVYVNANGDGLDANGSIELNGGNVTIVGTTSNGNSALDYDNSFNVNGGSIVYYGATGMWQNPSNSSKQNSICFNVSGKSGDEIILKDSSGNIVASVKTEKSYGAITISNSNLKQGETYALYINETSSGSQQISNIVTSNLSIGGMNGEMNGKLKAEMKENMEIQQNTRMTDRKKIKNIILTKNLILIYN